MYHNKLLCLLLGVLLVLSLAGCKKKEEQPPEDPNFPVTLSADGGELTIQSKPTAVVSLSPAITQLLLELGGGDVLAGVSDYAPQQAADKPSCGTAQGVDLAAVERIAPQVLFTDTPLLTEQLTALYQMNVEVVLLRRPESFDQIKERAKAVSLALWGRQDGEAAAQDYAARWDSQWERILKAKASIAEGEQKSAVLLGRLDDIVATGDSFEGQMLSAIGLENLGDSGEHWHMDLTQQDEWDPQVIFYDSRIPEEDIRASDHYREGTAVKESALFPVDWVKLQTQTLQTLTQYEELLRFAYPDASLPQDAPPDPDPAPDPSPKE